MPRGVSGDSTPEQVFSGSPRGLDLFHAVERLLAAPTPPAVRATKSQVAFRAKRGFAYVWWPGRYVDSEVPVVLSSALPRRIESVRFKAIAHPSPGVWMHHLDCTTRSSSTPRLPAGCTRPVPRRARTGAGRAEASAGQVVAERGGRTGMVRPPGGAACYVWSILTFLAVLSGAATGAGARTSSTPSL